MKKKRKHKPSLADLERQRSRLRKKLCSEFWVDCKIAGKEPLPTGWVTCPACEIPMPPIYFSADICCDCAFGCMPKSFLDALPSSNFVKLLEG